MAPSDSGDSGLPFQSLLGDLMNMLGSSGPNQWQLTQSFALNVATGGSPEGNVDPVQRMQLEQLARVAELSVMEATGLELTPGGHQISVVPVNRSEWTNRALASWRTLLEAMAPVPPEQAAPTTDPLVAMESGGLEGMAGLFGQWATTIGPMFFGLQVGSVVGHLAQRTLGQYPLAVPWAPSNELLFVLTNITAFAEDWSLPHDETLIWVLARELAANAVLTIPALKARIEATMLEVATSSAHAQGDLLGRLGGLLSGSSPEGLDDLGGGMDLSALQGMMGDPEALLSGLLTPEASWSSDLLTAWAVVIDAYADHIANVVGARLIGSHQTLAEAWYRRRTERGKGEEAAGALFGLDLDQEQVDLGRAFISGVIERAGEDGLARLWTSPDHLPTPAEVRAPGLWLERISLPGLDPPN